MFFVKRFASALLLAAFLPVSQPAEAQVPPNCEVSTAADPDREVLVCAFGLVIEMEAAAQMGFTGAVSDTDATVIELNDGAALFDVEPGQARPQIRTPHAIAAVRGTIYIVDVSASQTSVFVVQGEVAVSTLDDSSGPVTLVAGEGVDVVPGTPLKVVSWGKERVSALLARFGR
ncbi:FecR family protein [Roseobacter sp. YSTF-M11]|uniref:FecR family protein n=1 Tax=Roseobacter insulae TaxID=2859783 RepID=A0A9X1JZH4_9RHOB|nr:FecR family protein [Roseobacter insulae]MBW4707189.1 FecR family protein [Roseobacter insulae]